MLIVAVVAAGVLGQASGPRSGPERVNWWNDRVFYQVFPRSYADSTTGPLAGDGIGDLQGIIEHLDDLNDGKSETTTDLGVGGIWLTPFYPSPSYHGYDITDYESVHPQLGTMDDFKRLVAECHRRGIKVIVDLVMNHCSSRHEWFTKASEPGSKQLDWFIWAEKDPGWKGPWDQRVWHRLPPRAGEATELYYYGLFSHTMPDLNFKSPVITDAMNQITRHWVTTFGADGVRLDAIRHLIEDGQVQQNTDATHAWLRDWFLNFKGANLDALSIGEVWADSEQAASYVGDQMDMVFEFALAEAMVAAAASGKKEAFEAAQAKVLTLYPPNQYGRFLSNHDQTRVMTRLKGEAGAMRTAAAMLLLGAGVPFVYYGEEIGMTGDKPDENLRTPMQWTSGANAGFTTGKPWAAINAGFERVNVEAEQGERDSLLNTYRGLIHLRNSSPALATGGMWMVRTDRPEVTAFVRKRTAKRAGESQAFIVVINLGRDPINACTLSMERGPLSGKFDGTDRIGGATLSPLDADAAGAINAAVVHGLGPQQAAVFELKAVKP